MARPALFDTPMTSADARITRFLHTYDELSESADERDRAKALAKRDYKAFMRLMYPNYLDNWHLSALREKLELIERGKLHRLIVTMPPRHSKSMHVSEGFPAWFLGKNPTKRVIAASHTQGLARKFSRRVRRKFRDPNWPFETVAISSESSAVDQWEIAGEERGGYICVGREGSPTGEGGDLIIIDDPIKGESEARSPLIRENLWEWFEGTMYTRRQPGAAIIVTATRWHEDDLTGRLLSRMKDGGEAWDHLHLPAELSNGEYLWPGFWSDAEYEAAKQSSDRVWLAQYQGTPVRRGGNLLKEEWFPDVTPGETYFAIVQAWDTASEPGLSNDWSVCATIGVGINCYDVLHIWRDRVEFPDLLQAAKNQATWIQAIYPKLPYTLAIENASSGRQLIQMLRRDTRLPVINVDVENQKDAKFQRVLRTTPIASARRIRVNTRVSWRADFMREMKGFPYETHDDIVDAVMIGVEQASGGATAQASSRDYLVSDDPEPDLPTGTYRRRPPGPFAERL